MYAYTYTCTYIYIYIHTHTTIHTIVNVLAQAKRVQGLARLEARQDCPENDNYKLQNMIILLHNTYIYIYIYIIHICTILYYIISYTIKLYVFIIYIYI